MRSDALRRRETLLLAARRLFAARGRDVPLETVAEEAGVGIATLYRNFGSREELVQEVTLALLADLRGAAASATRRLVDAEPGRTPADAVWRQLVADLVGLELGALAQALAVRDVSELSPLVREAQIKAEAEVALVLEHMRSHGVVREDVGPLELVLGLGLVTRPLPEAVVHAAPELPQRMVQFLVAGMAARNPLL